MNLACFSKRFAIAVLAARANFKAILHLFVMCLMWGALPAFAQESDQKFSLYTAEGGLVNVYETQQQAEAAIKNIPGPAYAPTVYQYVKEIKGTKFSGGDEIAITYWMGAHQPSDPDWQYTLSVNNGSVKYSTEEEAVVAWKAALNQKAPNCPAAANAVPDGEWFEHYPGFENLQDRRYVVTRISGDGTPESPCESATSTVLGGIERSRRIDCPYKIMQGGQSILWWSDAYGACVNDSFFVTIKTSAPQCDSDVGAPSGLVGNPCDVKTGEKFETETDFDLGWIELTRYYHSGVASTSGGFGLGWSGSHGIHLAIDSSSLALIEGNGYTVPLHQVGSEYHAANGSGDRILPSGNQWKLYRQGEIYTFDGVGRLVSRVREDGSGLVYVYDTYGRMDAVASLQGRSIEFQYANTSGDALITSITSAGVLLAVYTYDESRLKTVTYPDGGTRIYHYEDSRFPRHLTGITAEDGQRYSTFAYDEKGRAISTQHAGGANATALSYSAGGTVVTDALGEQTTYVLTNAGGGSPKVTSVTGSAGTSSYTYYDASVDFRRRLDTQTDRNGTQTKHTYEEATDAVTGQPASIHTIREAFGLPEERAREERRDLASNRLLSARTGNREVRFAYNARLQPVSITIKDVVTNQLRVTTQSYCEAADVAAPDSTCPFEGLLKSVDGPRTDVADVTTYTYYQSDAPSCLTVPAACTYRKGDLWKITDALDKVVEILAYDGIGRPLSVKDANGVITDYEYHSRGWPAAQKVRGANDAAEADDHITRIEYWPTGLVKKITEPDGAFTSYSYDAAQRLTDVADNAGNTIHYTLDNAGNRLNEGAMDSNGTLKRTLSRVYNQLGQLGTLADAQSNATNFAYDTDGNLDIVIDALGRVTDEDYDPLNRLKHTLKDVAGIAAQTQFAYDALDNLTKVTDPKGLETTYAYNGFGDLVQQTSPDTGGTEYAYDSAGNRKTRVDARGVTAVYGYDALNRLVSVVYPDAGLNIAYAYDTVSAACQAGETFAAGRLSQLTDSSGSTQYCYDRFGQLVRKVQATNDAVFTVRYAYNAAGRLGSVTYPDGMLVDYVRNALGQVTAVGVTPAGGTRQVLLGQATYYPFGPVAGWVYGNGRSLQRIYDQDYRPQSIFDGASGGLDINFGFDAVGNLDALNTALSATPLLRFEHDTLGRLTQTQDGPTGTPIETYGYDATGNRTSFANSAGTKAYVYPAGSHRLQSVAGVVRTYDAAGNTISIGGAAREFVYDDAGRMAQVKQGGAVLATYAYNGKGERVHRSARIMDTYTVYDEAGRWLGDYDGIGGPVQQVIWLDDMPVGLLTGSPQQLHYIEPDHLGTPRVVIDPIRDVAVWAWDAKSEAFGDSPPSQDPDVDGTAFVLDMRFPGQRYDSVAGLNYNYFRDYDPGSGRYVQSDPIGLAGGISTYTYVSGNPNGGIDPLGLQSMPPGMKRSETGSMEIDLRYWLNRALETLGLPASAPVAAAVQAKSFYEMRQDNTIGNDKYFHCVANCQSRRLAGETATCAAAGAREDSQEMANWHNEDRLADEAANAFGRSSASRGGSCQQGCSQFIVNGINPKYLPSE